MARRVGGMLGLLVAVAALPGCRNKLDAKTCVEWKIHAKEVQRVELERFTNTASPAKLTNSGEFVADQYKFHVKDLDNMCENLNLDHYKDPLTDQDAACFIAAKTGVAMKACKLPANGVLEGFAYPGAILAELTDRPD